MRLDKFLTQMKYGSRKDIKNLIKERHVQVDQVLVLDPSFDVLPEESTISVKGETVFYQPNVYLMLYKPKGYVSANHDAMHPCAVDLIKAPYDRFDLNIAGRLDLDAEGLLLLSNDGDFIHQVTHPKKHLPKTYEVLLDQPFEYAQELLDGLEIKDGKNETYLAKALSVSIKENHVIIIIDEGKFHQVKRMFGALGYEVLHLKRTQIGQLSLKDLNPGDYIPIRKEELYE